MEKNKNNISTISTNLKTFCEKNKIEVKRLLGSGSFGHVYFVEKQGGASIPMALKELKLNSFDYEEDLKATINEIKLMKQCDCPNIVKYLGSTLEEDHDFRDVPNDFHCIFSEYCEGGDLENLILKKINESSKFEMKEILDMVLQILNGLAYLHSDAIKIIHKDIKPQNIFVKDNQLKLGDFKFAQQIKTDMNSSIHLAGTLTYMAPEVYDNKITFKSDIWSVGCVIYRLVFLKELFPFNSHRQVLTDICSFNAKEKIKIHCNSWLEEKVRNMLEQDENERSTAEQLLDDFKSQKLLMCKKDDRGESATTSKSHITIDTIDKVEWYNIGNDLSNMGSYEEAIVSYDQALDIDPNYEDALTKKGIALLKLGR